MDSPRRRKSLADLFGKVKVSVEYLKLVGLHKYIAAILAVIFATLYLNEIDKNNKLNNILTEYENSTFITLDSILINNTTKREVLISDVIKQANKIDSLLKEYRTANTDTISLDSAMHIIRGL